MLAIACTATAQSLQGQWDATVVVSGGTVPFKFEISGAGQNIRGSFFNGKEKITSTSGRFANGLLELTFDQYATKLEAKVQNDTLAGTYDRGSNGSFQFRAKRASSPPPVTGKIPMIDGLWEIELVGSKQEAAWHFVVRQSGGEVTGAILRIDGDTGELSGRYQDGKFVMSHFSGARPEVIEITPNPDGTLSILEDGVQKLTAVHASAARAQALPGPADPTNFTKMQNPNEPLRFAFPDLNGRLISSEDPQFHGKVLLVSIGGSWCPNCHDEAPLLVELYRKYHARGLEIIGLEFEEAEQLKDPKRLRAFVRKYGIEYPMLLAGEPGQLRAKVPQAVNLAAFPTTFFVGRNGLVRSIHVGFASTATGEFYTRLRKEVTAQVEELLAEDAPRR
jgi:thiol-disulfide isomerase/thioredoxin